MWVHGPGLKIPLKYLCLWTCSCVYHRKSPFEAVCVCVCVCVLVQRLKQILSTGLWDIVIDNVCSVNVHARWAALFTHTFINIPDVCINAIHGEFWLLHRFSAHWKTIRMKYNIAFLWRSALVNSSTQEVDVCTPVRSSAEKHFQSAKVPAKQNFTL